MSKLSNLIFHKADHYITSPFGYRKSFSTLAGTTGSFHSGVDYGTNGKKIPQYAITDGYIYSCGIDYAYGGAKYVWVAYPSLGVKMLHYHLDEIKVKNGQKVNTTTMLGTTGMSGRATGIHLHLGLKKLSGGDYIDPEKWSKNVFESTGYSVGNYRVTTEVLNVRKGAGTKYAKIPFKKMTADAQAKIKKLAGKKVNGYVKGLAFTASTIKGHWGRTPSGWVCLDYCEKVN